jgi:leucyl/phenylalanyl-tRNA--protein transferase
MFHRPDIGRDASKAALVGLVEHLRQAGNEGERLLDVQWRTPHLESLGVVEIPRAEYLRRLEIALTLPTPSWPRG